VPMPDDIVSFGFVVEGEGEMEAVPLLIRRICNDLFGTFALRTTQPVRITKSKLVRPGELERAIQLVQKRTPGPILVLLDADEDCPAILGPDLKSRSLAIIPRQNFSVVIPTCEFEAWFIAAAQSLSGKRGLRQGLLPPPDPESIRGAKEWLSRNMVPERKYSPSVDQVSLVASMDLTAARSCKSFDRLCREIERLVSAPAEAEQETT
jgi:uncharacterized protein DUF4276